MWWYMLFLWLGSLMQGVHPYPNEVVNGRLYGETYLYEYGYFRENNHWEQKDGFVRVMDPQTNELIHTFVISKEYMVDVTFIADVGDALIVVVEHSRYIQDFSVWYHYPTELMLIQKDGYFIDSIEIEKRIFYSGNVFDQLIVQLEQHGPYYQVDSSLNIIPLIQQIDWNPQERFRCFGQCNIMEESENYQPLDSAQYTLSYMNFTGVTLRFYLTIHPKWVNELSLHDPYEPIEISTSGILKINGQVTPSPYLLETPGIYMIDILGYFGYHYQKEITIEPKLNDILQNSTSKESIPIFTNAPSIFVNGEKVSNGYTLTRAGKYEIVLEGINGLKRSYQVEILPSFRGVESHSVSAKPVTIYVNGVAKINGELFVDNILLDKSGYYILELYKENQIYETIQFRIDIPLPLEEENAWSEINWVQILLAVVGFIGLYFIIKKK